MTNSCDNIPLGMLIVSLKGRDKGKQSVIVGHPKPDFVLIADGKYRKMASPKLKRCKHVKPLGLLPVIATKLQQKAKVWDSELFSAIQSCDSVDDQ